MRAGGWCAGHAIRPRIDRCVVDNWQQLTCSWKPSTRQQHHHMLHSNKITNQLSWTTSHT